MLAIAMVFFTACEKESMSEPGALVPRTVDQDHALPSLKLNGTQLHVKTFGSSSNPIIVMVHGGPGADYRSLMSAKAYADNGFFVVFYDQRGTGLSKREDREQFEKNDAVQLMIDDLNALINHFQQSDKQKVFLIGHSWGAMLSTAYINAYPTRISGVVLAEPGGFTWTQTEEYLGRSNQIKFFSEALNDAIYPEQMFAGKDVHEVLDYKASFFSTFENAEGNTIGNASSYPFWRNGAVAFDALIQHAEVHGFDFTAHLSKYNTKVLFAYSELNSAYGLEWAKKVSAPYPKVEFTEIQNSGHELLYFGWDDFYPKTLTYLNSLK